MSDHDGHLHPILEMRFPSYLSEKVQAPQNGPILFSAMENPQLFPFLKSENLKQKASSHFCPTLPVQH